MEGFRHYPAQRSAILDDIIGSVLPNLRMGKRTQRDFLCGDASQLKIQMLSALMLQLVQVLFPAPFHIGTQCLGCTDRECSLVVGAGAACSELTGLCVLCKQKRVLVQHRFCLRDTLCVQVSVQLPSTETIAPEQKDCYAPAMHWADVFWNTCLQRCARSCNTANAVRCSKNNAWMNRTEETGEPCFHQSTLLRGTHYSTMRIQPDRQDTCVWCSEARTVSCRLAVSRAQRNDADVDMKQLLEQVTVDLLLVHNLPEWPAALPMLLRLVTALLGKAGMHSPDNAVRSVSVDLLGLVAAQLCYEAHVAGAEAGAADEIIKKHGDFSPFPLS